MLLVAIICSVGSGVCQPMMLLAFTKLFGFLGQGGIAGLSIPMELPPRDMRHPQFH